MEHWVIHFAGIPALVSSHWSLQRHCEHGLEAVVAKKHSGHYRRDWVKTKSPDSWRRDEENCDAEDT